MTNDLELAAVIFALKIWRHYLYGVFCDIYTYRKSLKYIFTQKKFNMHLRRLLELIKHYDLNNHYNPGKANVVVDALSRKFGGYLVALLTQQLSLLREIEKMQIEVLIKEPRLGISHVNQVSIRFDLYEKIKEAQHKDDRIIKNIKKVQRGET